MKLELYTQPFCAPCVRARQTVQRVCQLLPDLEVEEIDVVRQTDRGAALGLSSTPVIRLLGGGRELMRAAEAPTVNQLLAAVARAWEESSDQSHAGHSAPDARITPADGEE